MINAVRQLGPLKQLGYVVADLDRAIDDWAADGVGPWTFLPHVDTENFEYQGRHSTLDMSIGISYVGGMQVELIQQHCDQPSLYRDFLTSSGEGLQHLGYFPADFDATLASVTRAGWSIGQQGFLGSGRFVYFGNQHHPGTTMEIAEINDRRRTFFADIAAQCQGWDGAGDARRAAPGHGRKASVGD